MTRTWPRSNVPDAATGAIAISRGSIDAPLVEVCSHNARAYRTRRRASPGPTHHRSCSSRSVER